MCGIVGIYHYGRSADPVSVDLLVRLRDTLRHRGPDDAGVWLNPARNLGLGLRRLSIIDLSPAGHQPLANETETVWVTYNGEIYNYLDLRRELADKGHRFRSHTDSEVLPHLYEEVGPDCVARLDGMFAFGLWDEEAQKLFLARDRLGVKPLYYTRQQGLFLFASEIKALLAHPLVGRDIDPEALYHYLTFKTTPAPWTMFAGIHKLPAGHWLTCDKQGDLRIQRYWDPTSAPPPSEVPGDLSQAVTTVREMLTRAVAKRQMADVPTGVFLSGGLDSSAIVALLAPQADRPLNTFTVGIKDLEGVNEFEYARQVAALYRTNHREILIGRKEVEDFLPQMVYHQDEPLADPVSVPLYYLAQHARREGVIVVQVGEGSDEQFLGYESRLNFVRRYAATWGRLASLPRSLLWGLYGSVTLLHGLTRWGARYRRILGKAARRDELFWGSVAFDEEAKVRLLDGNGTFAKYSSQQVVREVLRPLRTAGPRADVAAQVAYLDLKLRLAELLLMRVDKITMSVGVEAREPFLDYRLVEYLLALPGPWKFHGNESKYLLKKALTGLLPDNILNRPKQIFAAPINLWLRGEFADFARQVLFQSKLRERNFFDYHEIAQLMDDHLAGRADRGVQIWTLMNLSAWYDHWIAGRN